MLWNPGVHKIFQTSSSRLKIQEARWVT